MNKLPPIKLALHCNENSLDVSPKAMRAIIDSINVGFCYPDHYLADLLATLAEKFAIDLDYLSIGSG